jgi:lipoprotein-anchoring transpeptidase ErfK/SrfK
LIAFAGASGRRSGRPELRRARSLLALAGTSCVLAAMGAHAPAPAVAAGTAKAGASQELAVLLSTHAVHRRPQGGSRVLVTVPAVRPITGEPTTLPVIGHARSGGGIAWLRVMLPGRPNGSSGWIAKQGTRAQLTGWRISVSLGARRVTVYRHGRAIRRFAAVVGKPATPTPTGGFFVEETLQMTPSEPGGPYALALSARSNALQEFEGGPGQIALHGRDNLGGVLGAAESHGCVRLATASIDWLAQRIGPGVPVTIAAR